MERALTMVDGALLLVDASEGPLPQTRFVLRKALELRLPIILVINKVDRPDARISEVVDEVYELFIDLDADSEQIDFPIIYTNAKDGLGVARAGGRGDRPDAAAEPDAGADPGADLRRGRAAAGARDQPRRLPLPGAPGGLPGAAGDDQNGQQIAWCRADGTIKRAAVSELFITEGLERVSAEEAGPGEIIAVAGIEEVTIGETLADPENPVALPVITVDEPSLSLVLGINTSPMAGQGGGNKLTARQIRSRLDQELVGNVSIRVNDTERPDAWEVQGRGELQLVVLLEIMRREGFEMTAGQPRVVTREIDGKVHEPVERLAIDVPEEHVGSVTQMLAGRKGRLEQMVNHSTGWVRMDYLVPARGLIGFRTEFLTETRGGGILHHVFDRWEPWAGELRTRQTGSLVADRRGQTAAYSLFGLQDRGIALHRLRRGRLRGDDHRRERPRRRPRRQPDQSQAADQHARLERRRAGAPGAADAPDPGSLARVPPRRRVRRSDPRRRSACAS